MIKANLVERLFLEATPSGLEQDLVRRNRENGKNEKRCHEGKMRHHSGC